MKFVLIDADRTGETSLSEHEWDLHPGNFTPPSPSGYEVTRSLASRGILMMHHPKGYIDDWHCAPTTVLGTVLSGNVRIETSDHDFCVLRPGDQFVANDLIGRGHKMEEESGQPFDLALVVLDEPPVSFPCRPV